MLLDDACVLDAETSGSVAERTAKVFTWNTEWAAPRSRGWHWATQHLRPDSDLGVLAETRADAIREWGGHLVQGHSDWGYRPAHAARRKVALWSSSPWRDLDPEGSPALPPGRFVAATTGTPTGPLRAIGVCIPWSAAHVDTGRRDARKWEEHLAYLAALTPILERELAAHPLVVVAGDFNQRLAQTDTRDPAPPHVRDALQSTFERLDLVTTGMIGPRPLLDHVALSPSLRMVGGPAVLPCDSETGYHSDHDAVAVTLTTF